VLVACDVIAQQSNSIIHQLFVCNQWWGESTIAQWYHWDHHTIFFVDHFDFMNDLQFYGTMFD
jgi:hypothetical protein